MNNFKTTLRTQIILLSGSFALAVASVIAWLDSLSIHGLSISRSAAASEAGVASGGLTTVHLLIAFAALGLCFMCVVIATERMTAPLRQMTDSVAMRLQNRDVGKLRLPVDDRGEVGQLARLIERVVVQLKESQDQNESVVRDAVFGVIVFDQHGTIMQFNPACEQMFGYVGSDVIGQNVSVLLSEGHHPDQDDFMADYKSGKRSTKIKRAREIWARRRCGEDFVIEASVNTMWVNGKQLFCGMLRDLTETRAQRHAFERQKETLELALQSGRLGLWDWDIDAQHLHISDIWAGILGYEKHELDHDPGIFARLIHPEDGEETDRQMREIRRGTRTEYSAEFRMRHKRGHYVWIEGRGEVFDRDEKGTALRVVGVNQDITERKSQELDVRARNSQLETAETVAKIGHWRLNAETGELHWSNGMYVIHGYDPDEAAPTFDVAISAVHEDDRSLVNEALEYAIENGTPFRFQIRLFRLDGEMRHIIVSGEPWREGTNIDGRMLFGVLKDVTDQVLADARLESSEEKTRTLMDNVAEGVVMIREDGVIDGCNPALGKLFGYDSSKLIGASFMTLIPEEFLDEVQGGFAYYLRDKRDTKAGQSVELQGIRKSGERFTFEIAISQINVDGEKLITGIVRDITERKRMEVMKNEFVSTVNHELRTPLTAILGSLDLLRNLYRDRLDDDSMQLITLAHDGCGRLSTLVNDILDMDKIAAGKMEYSNAACEFRALVDDIVSRHQPLADKFKVNFKINHELEVEQVFVDPSRMNQALVNLLSNACKFSSEGSRIIISTGRPKRGWLRVSVQDFGPGISDAFKGRIFERFSQADGTTRRAQEGSGLGLSITKSIIEAFGGRVSFDTELNVGSTFHFDLPEYSAGAALPAEPVPQLRTA